MPSGLARLFVIPRLAPFLARYPDLRLELGMGLRPVHLLEEGVDCVVRFGAQSDSSLVARRVGTMSHICCASPAYLRKHGTPRRPDDLSAHRCVNYIADRTGRVMDWEFERAGQKLRLTLESILAVNDQDANIIAGLMGIGIAKDAGLAELETPAAAMIQDLLWWTAALKTARAGGSTVA
jgi:LysR family transcriptional regulator for bpeEF and oprC